MKVTEIFYSLQGEGIWLGRPAVFLRLGGCVEPYCPWCDTPYAWSEFLEMGIMEILKALGRYPCRNVVITGGEPFLQWEDLKVLHAQLIECGYALQYETSGKAGIPPMEDAVIVCSPKNIKGTWLIDTACLERADYLKFLYQGAASEGTIQRFIIDNHIPADKIYIMPEGATRKAQLEKMESAFAFCKIHGYMLTVRLHILIFDGGRGV